jgi:hypothetical protein
MGTSTRPNVPRGPEFVDLVTPVLQHYGGTLQHVGPEGPTASTARARALYFSVPASSNGKPL